MSAPASVRSVVSLVPLGQPVHPEIITAMWRRLLAGVEPPEAAFGPECWMLRPRGGDAYYDATSEGMSVGIVWFQSPAPTTRRFGMGLFREYQGRGLGLAVRDAAYALAFSDPRVWKLESEVYSSNQHSLGALHGAHARSHVEGTQRQTIRIGEQYYDRILFGITRDEWEDTHR